MVCVMWCHDRTIDLEEPKNKIYRENNKQNQVLDR
jgi:hypothetical protein